MTKHSWRRRYAIAGAIFGALAIALTLSCFAASTLAPRIQPASPGEIVGSGPEHSPGPPEGAPSLEFFAGPVGGPTLLKERILTADKVARVRLLSVAAGTTRYAPSDPPAAPVNIGTMEFRFRVLEYLKGSGPNEIVGVVDLADHTYENITKASAIEAANAVIAERDTRWDAREAVVFLDADPPNMPDFPQARRYSLGLVSEQRGPSLGDMYTVASPWDKTWLPSASTGGATGASEEKRYLMDAPAPADGATGQSSTPPTVTLTELKAEIAKVNQEVAVNGSDAYQACLAHKYRMEREVDFYKDQNDGVYRTLRYDESTESGLPAGTFVHYKYGWPTPAPSSGPTPTSVPGSLVISDAPGRWVASGRDHGLFAANRSGRVDTTRPLPSGEYRFYFGFEKQEYVICDAEPAELKKSIEVVVSVTVPAGTVHEAFFDPVAVGTAVGVDATNGALSPTAFTVGGVSTALQSLKWQGSTVALELSPAASLTGHALDFITLDGSVALSLDGGAATVSSGTLTWSVTDQPWQAGDLLMLRIRQA